MTEHKFPNSLKGFGYAFNADGKLRKINEETGSITDDPFEFNISDDANYNQKRYEALGEVITEYVYELLDKEGLSKLPVPKDPSVSTNAKSFIFASPDAGKKEKILLLIHGTGVVRAGQWSRRLIINDTIATGTQIPYIRKAQELGYGVFILNTNDNYRILNGKSQVIKGSSNPLEHLETVWNDYIDMATCKTIDIKAHSYGGEVVARFADKFPSKFASKVNAVALTDSYPTKTTHLLNSNNCKCWASSNKPLNHPVESGSTQFPFVSAGNPIHEMTPSTSMEAIFQFFQEKHVDS